MEERPYKMPKRKHPRRWLERAAIWVGAFLILVSFGLGIYKRSIYPPVFAVNVGTAEHRQEVAAIWEYRRRVGLVSGAFFLPGFVLVLWGITVERWRDATDFN